MIASPSYLTSCLICQQRDDGMFSISFRSGVYCAKDDIIEFLGPKVECMLDDDYVICNGCSNIFENIANFKRQIFSIINNRYENEDNPFEFGHIWASFLSNLNLNIPTDYDSTSSMSDLLVQKYSIPENQLSDMNLMEAEEKCKRLQTFSSLNNHLHLEDEDKEIEEAFQPLKKRRKRGRQRRFTRVKSTSRARSTSDVVRQRKTSSSNRSSVSRSHSELHRLSTSPSLSLYHSMFSSPSSLKIPSCSALKRDMSINTRSISRTQNEIRNKIEIIKNSLFKCSDPFCQHILFDTLDELTKHRIEFHKCMAYFKCEECKNNFITEEDLQKHQEAQHRNVQMHCPCCSELQANVTKLQNHLKEHLMYSVPCIYCDKKFLNKQKCDKHVEENHRGRKKRIRLKRPISILDRVFKYNNNSTVKNTAEVRHSEENQFDVRLRPQIGVQRESPCFHRLLD